MKVRGKRRLVINPFVSQAQRAACYTKQEAGEEGWDCEEWSKKTPKKLPKRKKGTHNSVPLGWKRSLLLNRTTDRRDPTGTEPIRRAFNDVLKKRFAQLGKRVADYLGQVLSQNAFCPTGDGGGVDPSCSKSGWRDYNTRHGLLSVGVNQSRSKIVDMLAKSETKQGKGFIRGKDVYVWADDIPYPDHMDVVKRVGLELSSLTTFNIRLRGDSIEVANLMQPHEMEILREHFDKPTRNSSSLPKETWLAMGDAAAQTERPTPKQAEAGNYKKGKVSVQGLPVTIETPAGVKRKPYHSKPVQFHYGYIRGTDAVDGDQVDVFLGPNPDAPMVYVVDQMKHDGKTYDEPKVMLGFDSEAEAVAGYRSNYDEDWKGFGGVTAMTVADFKEWLDRQGTVGGPGWDKMTQDQRNALVDKRMDEAVWKQRVGFNARWTPPAVNSVARIIDVPDIRQKDHFSCGACAAMCVGQYFGVGPKELEEWKDALGTSLQKSTHPYAIAEYLRSLGCQVEDKMGMTLENLEQYVDRGWPVICCVQDYGNRRERGASFQYGHYLTVIGIIRDSVDGEWRVICQDSSEENAMQPSTLAGGTEGSVQEPGRIIIRGDEWMRVWHDEDEHGTKFVHWGCAVGPPDGWAANTSGWVGVDLDGTLAHYDGYGKGEIGEPIPAMLQRVKQWLADGEDVRIVTARAADEKDKVEQWCQKYLGRVLPVTDRKDHQMRELWDDRARQVEKNTGRVATLNFDPSEPRDEHGMWTSEGEGAAVAEEHGHGGHEHHPPGAHTVHASELLEHTEHIGHLAELHGEAIEHALHGLGKVGTAGSVAGAALTLGKVMHVPHVADIEHAVVNYVGDKINHATNLLPKPLRALANATFFGIRTGWKTGWKVAFVNWHLVQPMVEKVAKERGLSDEEARRLRGRCSSIDLSTFEALKIGAVTGFHPAHVPAMITGAIPVASASYLAYSTARDPAATWRAAVKAITGWIPKQEIPITPGNNPPINPTGMKTAYWGKSHNIASGTGAVEFVADALATHHWDDWYDALLAAALDSVGDLRKAKDIADSAYKAQPTHNAAESKQIKAFQKWLRLQMDNLLVGADSEALWNAYIQKGFDKGAGRIAKDMGYDPSKTIIGKESVEKVKLLAGRAFDELKNVSHDTATKMSRVLTDALVQGKHPSQAAREMNKVTDLGYKRAKLVAQTEFITTHASGQIMQMKKLGAKSAEVAVEFSDAGDEDVCPKCEALSGKVFDMDDPAVEGLISVHPGCRCCWVPSLQEPTHNARLVRLLHNTFCATGVGGGVEPSCGKEHTAPSKFAGEPVGKPEHVHAAMVERQVAGMVGGKWEEDNAVYDVSRGKDGIEVKSLLKGTKNKITVHPDALVRKVDWVKENPSRRFHTVVIDDRDTFAGGKYADRHSGHRIYYKRGSGRYALSQMHPVQSVAELKRLMRMPNSQLPEKARGGLPRGETLKTLRDQAEANHQRRIEDNRKRRAEGRIHNAFCATGKGGGVDPSCSPGSESSVPPPPEQGGDLAVQQSYIKDAAQMASSEFVQHRAARLAEKMEHNDRRWAPVQEKVAGMADRLNKLESAHQRVCDRMNKLFADDAEGMKSGRGALHTSDEYDALGLKADEALGKFLRYRREMIDRAWKEIGKHVQSDDTKFETGFSPIRTVILKPNTSGNPIYNLTTPQFNAVADVQGRLNGRISSGLSQRIEATDVRSIPVTEEQRAHFSSTRHGGDAQSIYLPANSRSESTVAHELGHSLETNANVHAAAQGFLYMRVGQEEAKPINQLGGSYKSWEVGRDDDFAKAFGDSARYVGKHYKTDDTEITSMGLEKMVSDPVRFAKQDPQYFKFMLGVLDGTFT